MDQKKILNLPSRHLPIIPLTQRELHQTANERVSLISKEFTDGFNFLSHYPKSVTIFGGSHFKENDIEYTKARDLSAGIIKKLGYAVFTGGGPGIMEAANRGAYDVGGQSLGFSIELPDIQVKNQYLTKSLGFHYFFSRKVCLAFSAEAYVFFPGGFGTLDEFFEIITLVQTGKIEKVPMILFGSDFWNPLDQLLKKELLSRNTIMPEDLTLYTITDNENEVINIIRNAPVRNGIEFHHSDEDLKTTLIE